MSKYAIESPQLYDEVVDYLKAQGVSTDGLTQENVTITTPGSAKTPRQCLSGSGLMTSGGRFAPGYDAKAKAALYAIIRGKPDDVPTELVKNGPFYTPIGDWTPDMAVAKLREMGWPEPVPPKPKAVKPPKEPKADNGEANTSTKAGRRKASAKKADEPVSETV